MPLNNIGIILICAAIVCGLFLVTSFIFYQYIYVDYKHRSVPMTAKELFETLQSVMASEIDIYEKNIFQKYGNVLDSNSYENYYQTLCNQILGDLSPMFFQRASYILPEEVVASIVTRNVQNYLSTKLATGGINTTEEESM